MAKDLIERSKVIEELKAVKEKGNIFCSVNPEKKAEKTPHAFVILRKALDAVDAIPATEAAPQWIPASEPPKENDEYNVMIQGASKATTLYYRTQENIWFDDAINIYKATHWQPLPQPPEEIKK